MDSLCPSDCILKIKSFYRPECKSKEEIILLLFLKGTLQFSQTTNHSNKNFFAIKKYVPNLKVIFENKHKVQRENWSL
jgi:hypothetical protein